MIFTPHSGGTFALQAFNERDGFLVVSYTSVPAVTSKGNKLTVKIPPNFTDYIEPFSRITMDRFGWMKDVGGPAKARERGRDLGADQS